jgi:hypothetical protein
MAKQQKKTTTGQNRLKGASDGKPWAKGVSGNPKGRPANSVTTWMKRMLDSNYIEFSLKMKRPNQKDVNLEFKLDVSKSQKGEDVSTIGQAIAAVVIQQSLQGDMKAVEIILNRTDGPVTQKLDLSSMSREEMIAIISQMAK